MVPFVGRETIIWPFTQVQRAKVVYELLISMIFLAIMFLVGVREVPGGIRVIGLAVVHYLASQSN